LGVGFRVQGWDCMLQDSGCRVEVQGLALKV